ncbi:hypothetical protein [Thiolapillus sp.]|uniref:hypothetical protein n=1 Tax=Thiolapillus sp. TaxID=2017437 RepID=UPI003AF584BB
MFSALCRDHRVTLLDSRLYLPNSWVEDEARCQRARVPEEVRQLRSKCTLAVSAPESTPFFRTPSATDFLLSHHNAGECHGPDRQY